MRREGWARLWCLLLLLVASSTLADAKKQSCSATAIYQDGRPTKKKQCTIEAETGNDKQTGGIHPNFEFMKNSRWFWNEWRDVVFLADGSFLAPAQGCEKKGNPRCRWSADESTVFVHWADAGLHTLTVSADGNSMSGQRELDGEGCQATRRA